MGFLNSKESEHGFCVSLLNRSMQDLSDNGALKEPKNPLPERSRGDFSVPLTQDDPREVGLICVVNKRKICFRILSDLDIRILSWIFLKKRTLKL